MNNLAIVPHIVLHTLQLHNVKRDTVKKHDIKELVVNETYSQNAVESERIVDDPNGAVV
jgi:hypothetical protein